MGIWDSITDAFSRDGIVTKFSEKIPIVGLGTAAIQAIAGNTEHAKRALANNLNSCITTAGTVGGFVVGGPVGAVAGGALGSSVGIGAEWAVSTTIDDANVKGNTGDTSLTRFALDGALGGVSGMIGGGGSGAVIKQVGTVLTEEAGKSIAKTTAAAVVKTAMYGQVGQAIIDTTKDTLSQPQSQGQSQGQGQTSNPPQPSKPSTEGEDKIPDPNLVRAISPNQATVGQAFCHLLTVAEIEFAPYGWTVHDNPEMRQPLTVDLTGQFRQLSAYFVVNVLHASTLVMWDGVVAELREKLVNQRYAERVEQGIRAEPNAIDPRTGQMDMVWVGEMIRNWRQLVDQLINTQATAVDIALAGDANYLIHPSQVVQPAV